MTVFRPKYISFDCYGTLTRFRMTEMTRDMFADRIPVDRMNDFIRDFSTYRLDEILGPWKPYRDVLVNAIQRTAKRWGITASDAEGGSLLSCRPNLGAARRCGIGIVENRVEDPARHLVECIE